MGKYDDNDMEMKTRSKGHDNRGFEGDNGAVVKKTKGSCKNKAPKIVIITADDIYGKIDDINRDILETKCDIYKNLFVLSFSFDILFTAFMSLSNLESSVNSDDGLGTLSLSVIYVVLVASSVWVPSAVIGWLGLKRTMVCSILLFCPYFLANIYPQWYTLLPASVLVGLVAAPLWTANCGYINQLAKSYESIIGESISTVLVRFFGIFFMVFQTSQIWGNLISYGVFDKPEKEQSKSEKMMMTPNGISANKLNTSARQLESDRLLHCGLGYAGILPESLDSKRADDSRSSVKGEDSSAQHPEWYSVSSEMLQLCIIFSVCCLIAASIMAVWLDPLQSEPRPGRGSEESTGSERSSRKSILSFKLIKETARHAKNPLQMALIPLTVFSGLEQAFLFGDFTISFVTCYWGVAYVGFVMIVFGVVNATFSFLIGGPLTRMAGRSVAICLGALFTGSAIAVMFFWTRVSEWHPVLSEGHLIFVVVALWGAGDAVWKTQINGLYGALFRENRDVAYSAYRLLESSGFAAAFAYSGYLPTNCKLFIVLAFLIAGFLGYVFVEIKVKLSGDQARLAADVQPKTEN